MKLTIRRIKLDRGGYDERGMYWGVGERLYSCDEAEEAREGCVCYFREHSECRAPNVATARVIFKARIERMTKPGHLKGAWV